jgi:hypothetical protein
LFFLRIPIKSLLQMNSHFFKTKSIPPYLTSINSPLKNTHERDLQISGGIKNKSDNLSHMDIEDNNSENKRQRWPSIILKDHYVLSVDDINLKDDPMNFKEATNSIDADKWIEAMNYDIDSIRNNDV